MLPLIPPRELRSEALVGARDFYQLLDVPTDADPAAIDRAFRRHLAQSPAQFDDLYREAIQAVYAKIVLCSPDRRELYDTVGHDTYFDLLESGQPIDELLIRVRKRVAAAENPAKAVATMGPDSHS
jgi:hypothetical protein